VGRMDKKEGKRENKRGRGREREENEWERMRE
jgi:hypothetical protein